MVYHYIRGTSKNLSTRILDHLYSTCTRLFVLLIHRPVFILNEAHNTKLKCKFIQYNLLKFITIKTAPMVYPQTENIVIFLINHIRELQILITKSFFHNQKVVHKYRIV